MREAVQEVKPSLSDRLDILLSFTLSDKFKFAVKTSLAMALAYIIPFSQGWAQAQTAAITIMLIAVAGPVSDSITKGLLRVIGTIIGAIIGMSLIALFPQDRELYLIALSLCVSMALYLTRAYKGDNTIFMLTAVTMMMVFQNGKVDDVFIYGINKTFMTIFGIALYTFIGIFLWPVRVKDNTLEQTHAMIAAQSELYRHQDDEAAKRKTYYEALQTQEKALETAVTAAINETESLSSEQKNTLLQDQKKINELLILLSYHDEAHFASDYTYYVSNFKRADAEIQRLFEALNEAIPKQKPIGIPEKWVADYDSEKIAELSYIDRAAFTATILDISKLHQALRTLAIKINAVTSPYPTTFALSSKASPSKFSWFDVEDMKGTLISFFIFWATTAFWVLVNPPAGFLVVTLATVMSVLTTFSPLKPSLLIIIFTLSFIFATLMYIFVLPHVLYSWELFLFLFFYAFIGFYFIKPMLSIFFLLGMAVLGLGNPMYYNFNLFLLILFVFYLFLFVLLLFYYIPFSTKPEVLFLKLKNRFFRLSSNLIRRSVNLVRGQGTFWGNLEARYSETQLFNSVKKMQLWASKVDESYFHEIDKGTLMLFTKNCETFAYLLQMMYRHDKNNVNNPLLKRFLSDHVEHSISELLENYAKGKSVHEVDDYWHDETGIEQKIEQHLETALSFLKADDYSQSDIIAFYENIALRRNVWISFLTCQKQMQVLQFTALKESRF